MSNKAVPTLTEKECRTLAQTWQCFETEPRVNYEKLAAISGYTVGSAKYALSAIKRKLKAIEGASGAAFASGSTTPKSNRKGKTNEGSASASKRKADMAAAADEFTDDDEPALQDTPSRKRSRAASTAGVKKEAAYKGKGKEVMKEEDDAGREFSGLEDYEEMFLMDHVKLEESDEA